MPYTPFVPNTPIADDAVTAIVTTAEQNLQAIRDAVVSGNFAGWRFYPTTGTGSVEEPQYWWWERTDPFGRLEQLRASVTWGTYGPTEILWLWRSDANIDSDWRAIGTETITWDGSGNFTVVSWASELDGLTVDRSKPVATGEIALVTVDRIRQNSMAARDEAVTNMAAFWDYSQSGGTAEHPTTIGWQTGVGPERVNGAVTWDVSKGRITQIVWTYRATSGSGYVAMGTQAFTYDAENTVTAITWSGSPARQFGDNTPTIAGSNAITLIRENVQALHEGSFMGLLFGWDYSLVVGSGSSERPQFLFYKKGAQWLRITCSYGASGNGEGSVTQHVVDYSENSGSVYDRIGTLNFTYGSAAGIVSNAVWAA